MTHFFNYLIETQAGLLSVFLAAAALVVLTGIKLSIYGDALGDRTGLGNGLVGLVFLAAATSLPELVVSLTSVLAAGELSQGVDLATGNMLGSNVFNLLILALMALLFAKNFNPEKMDHPHTDSTVYGLLMLAVFAVAFMAAGVNRWLIPGLHCFWPLLALPVLYLAILIREHRQHLEDTGEEPHLLSEDRLTQIPALRFYSALLGLSGLIIGGGILLSLLGSRMALPAEQGGFGLDSSLIGTVFLAISTSLPELVISFASIRMGFLDMAVGNVLGSNLFNLLIIFVADVAIRNESMLEHASSRHWASAGLILVLTLLSALLLRTRKKSHARLIAVGMLIIYAIAMLFFI